MEFDLTIADLTSQIRIEFPDDAFSDELGASVYGAFVSDNRSPALIFHLRLLSPGAKLPDATQNDGRVVANVKSGSLTMAWRDGELRFDRRTCAGRINLRPALPAFTTGLRAALAFALPDFNGFLLHAAGVIRRGRALLFFGASGSGKTTIAKLAEDPILSDDAVGVRWIGGQVWAYATPFNGDYRGAPPPRPHVAPVAAAFHLAHAPATTIARLQPAEATRRLSRCLMFDFDDYGYRERLSRQALDFVANVPCYVLRFAPTLDLWQVVDGLEV